MGAIPLIRADFSAPKPSQQMALPSLPSGDPVLSGLHGYIRTCFEQAKSHRMNSGVDNRLLAALRAIRGEYDPDTLNDIRAFGGSEVYARITAGKVRSCAALLREVYNTVDRPWAASVTPVPTTPGPEVDQLVRERLQAEALQMQAAIQQMAQQAQQLAAAAQAAMEQGNPEGEQMQAAAAQAAQMVEQMASGLNEQALRERATTLRDEISQMRKKKAADEMHQREDILDDILTEGGFYRALWLFLGDIAAFPIAIIKGPVTQMQNKLRWGDDGKPSVEEVPAPVWSHCSPFDVFFAPWSQDVDDGYVIHRERVTRDVVSRLRNLRNYSADAIDKILSNWGSHNCSWYDHTESERADLERRVSDTNSFNRDPRAATMPMLSFYGSVPREHLISWGAPEETLPPGDPNVFAYLLGGEVIGVTTNPHPMGRQPFYTDSFERVAGSVYGHGIPDLLDDIQAVGSATLRAVTNNLSMSSGPMVWINEDRMVENDANGVKIHPWKIFRFTDPNSSAGGGSEKPMEFFQPNNNAEQLFNVFERLQVMADEVSTIPRYMQGNGQGVGGAGRTAAGLSMLMEAGGRTIKQTVGSIDSNVMERVITDLNVYLSLTRPDMIKGGDISITARGATELMQKETLRMRRLEFLNITNNPVDMQIVGAEGRFHLLRELARDLQLPVRDSISFTEEEMNKLTELMKAQMLQQLSGGGANGNTPPPGGGNPDPQGQQQNHPKQQPSAGVARGPDMNPGR